MQVGTKARVGFLLYQAVSQGHARGCQGHVCPHYGYSWALNCHCGDGGSDTYAETSLHANHVHAQSDCPLRPNPKKPFHHCLSSCSLDVVI